MSQSSSLNELKNKLQQYLDYAETQQEADAIRELLYDLDDGIKEYEELIWEAKNIGLRNPSFEDDYVGWLDDDFDDDDDEGNDF